MPNNATEQFAPILKCIIIKLYGIKLDTFLCIGLHEQQISVRYLKVI